MKSSYLYGMKFLRSALLFSLFILSFAAKAQNISLLGKTDEYIMESVTGYAKVYERALEHEQFNILVFEDGERELSFYFTFYQGGKVCEYIRSYTPISKESEDVKIVRSTFTNIKDNVWQNADKTVEARITGSPTESILVLKNVRQ